MRARVGVVVLALCGLSACQSGPGRFAGRFPEHRFEEFESADSDRDGKLSREEAAAFPEHQRFFDYLDSDASGFLSWQEFKLATKPDLRPPRMPGQP